jgi:quercetin dioxygenase-like cupin family protein
MSAGIMVLPPHGGRLEPHRHTQAEIYFVAAGAGVLTINGTERVIASGAAAFIPGDALHGLRNDGPEALRIFYVFPTGAFSEIIYRF